MPKPSKQASVKELSWAAGFIEGEGSFVKSSNGSISVAARQVNKEPLIRLQELLGGSISLELRRPEPRFNRKPIHLWRICGSKAHGAMMTLYVLMSEKRKLQIKKTLKDYNTKNTRGGYHG